MRDRNGRRVSNDDGRKKSRSRNDRLSPPNNDDSQRRSSTTSVDSRTVASELNAQDEDELLGVLYDVQGFLQRSDGLPAYISKQQIFTELMRILKVKSVVPEKRAEVIDTSAQLIQAISGANNRRRNSNSPSEVSSCLSILMPAIIAQLPSKDAEVQQASLRLIQQCVQDDDRNGVVGPQTIGHLADDGLRHPSDKVSIETMKLLPGIFLPDIDDVDIVPLITALYEQLDIKNRDQFAFSALLRHREVLGAEPFSEYSSQMEPRHRNLFKILSQSYEDKDFHVAKKRPKDGVSFGMVPNTIINRLIDKHNRTMRAEGALMLKRDLETAVENEPDRFALLLPYMGSFVKFLGSLLADASPKVILHILECHELLLHNAQQAMRQHSQQIVHNLLKISTDSKVQIKIELFKLIKAVMLACSPQMVVDILLPELEHKNAKMREDVTNFVIYGLLTFPSTEFDMDELSRLIVPCVTDNKRRVRQSALECIALISQCLGPGKEQKLWTAVDEMEFGLYDDADEISDSIQCRLARKVLPRITDEGYIEYGLQIPHNYYTRTAYNSGKGGGGVKKTSQQVSIDNGADVDWILRGSGSVSRGSAGTISQLGVTGANGPYGSSISLQTSRNVSSPGASQQPRRVMNRSSSSSTIDSWNPHAPVPRIIEGRRRKSKSVSPPTSTEKAFHRLESDEAVSYSDQEQAYEKEEQEHQEEEEEEEERVLSPGEEKKRKNTYDTIPRSKSELSLRAAAATPPTQRRKNSLTSVSEESSKPSTAAASETKQSKKNSKSAMSFKKNTMVSMGLATDKKYQTQFDEDESMDDDEAPGAFRRPSSAFSLARSDLRSAQWQSEIEGLEAIVRLIKYHQDVIEADLDSLVSELNHECKNLRSQVTRAAIQTFYIMFGQLGRNIEPAKSVNTTVQLLLTKTADTNRFIRSDANAALDAFSENVSIYKVLTSLSNNGVTHKNVVARTTSARIIAGMVERIDTQAIYNGLGTKESRESSELIFKSGAALMADGGMDVRSEAKRIFKVLLKGERFEDVLRVTVPSEQVAKVRKQLIQLNKQVN